MNTYKPSDFANLGQPCCSLWGKSEIEWIALAYVQALANDGDEWKRLTREQTYASLTDEQKQNVHGMLTRDYEIDKRRFEMVADQITSAEGALAVRGFWNEHRLGLAKKTSEETNYG